MDSLCFTSRPGVLVQGRVLPRRRAAVIVCAGNRRAAATRRLPEIPADDKAPPSAPASEPGVILPRTGYLAIADTKADVYSKATEAFDPVKKLSRWKPEFIWNTNWQEALKRQEDLERQIKEAKEAKANAPAAPGDLGLSRLADLNNMEMDLSDVFAASARRVAAEKVQKAEDEELRAAQLASRDKSVDAGMSRNEVRKLTRVTARMARAAPSTRLVSSAVEQQVMRVAEAEAQAVAYAILKADFQLWTLGLTAVTAASTYAGYGTQVSISYLVGAAGGFVYLRLLGRSVDAVGESDGVAAGIASAAAQPRLLIPVGLVLVFNRWNVLYAGDTGVTLMLLPILAGFFTYKFAVFARQAKDVLSEMSIKRKVDAKEDA